MNTNRIKRNTLRVAKHGSDAVMIGAGAISLIVMAPVVCLDAVMYTIDEKVSKKLDDAEWKCYSDDYIMEAWD